jgi:hypothetical protein
MTSPHEPTAPPQETREVGFGFPDFWSRAYAKFEKQFGAIRDLIGLGNTIIGEAENCANESVQNVICALTRATMAGASEAILLCGNGCGSGAMKIVRGMYESRWTAEYLRRHPEEVQDYLEFGKVILWRRLKWLSEYRPSGTFPVPKQVEDDYNQVKARFIDGRGNVRHRWSPKGIGAIARDIGREREYELPYAMACSIHHANFEGLLPHFNFEGELAAPQFPPSDSWVGEALLTAHANLYSAIGTLNEACKLDFQQRIDHAGQTFVQLWSKQNMTRPKDEIQEAE